MNRQALEKWINYVMPTRLDLSVQDNTPPLYLRLQGKVKPLRYHPYILGIERGYATSSFDNHDEYETYDEALRAGMRHIFDYIHRGEPENFS